MRCEVCEGTGYAKNHRYIMPLPCAVCHGSGVGYCCDEAGVNPPNTVPWPMPAGYWKETPGKPDQFDWFTLDGEMTVFHMNGRPVGWDIQQAIFKAP